MAEKQKVLEMALTQIERQFGKGSIMRLGEASARFMLNQFTGALPLDIALGLEEFPEEELLKFLVLSLRAKQLLHYTL